MKFRTEMPIEARGITLGYYAPVMFVGSCFAQNIAAKMQAGEWPAHNPLGVLYNPLSISAALRGIAVLGDSEARKWLEDSLTERDGMWVSYMFASFLHGSTREEVAERFMSLREQTRAILMECDTLFITLGTAWVYRLAKAPNEVVANCHKKPAACFLRERLKVEECVDALQQIIEELRKLNGKLRVVLTVSPVRHLKDGLHGNNLSKAVLHLAVERLCATLRDVYYFPAYELVVDDLRSYRFYAADLAHPSDQAVEYVWEHFKASYMDARTLEALKAAEGRTRRQNHRTLLG